MVIFWCGLNNGCFTSLRFTMQNLSHSTPATKKITRPVLGVFIASLTLALAACTSVLPNEDRIAPKVSAVKVDAKEVMFIHGMFVTPSSWDQWRPMFEKAGYTVTAPAWPLHDIPIVRTKDAVHLTELGQLGLEEVLNHYRAILKAKPVKPILVGHSMGGLIAQKLLQEGLAQSAVAIDSVAPNGMLFVSWSFIKGQWPILTPFADGAKPVAMTREQFGYAFAPQQSEAVASAAYATQIVPESRKVAKDTLTASGEIDLTKARGPLLIIAGEKDNLIPAAMSYKNFGLYRNTPGLTEFKMFEGRDHWLIAGSGWEEVAGATLNWIKAQ